MEADPQDRSTWPVRKVHKEESDLDPEIDDMTTAERIHMPK